MRRSNAKPTSKTEKGVSQMNIIVRGLLSKGFISLTPDNEPSEFATCSKCKQVFDLFDQDQAAEFYYRHKCEEE